MPHQDFFRYARPSDNVTKRSHLSMYRGDTFVLKLGLVQDGEQTDISGSSIWFTVKNDLQDPDSQAVISKTTSNGIEILNAELGYIQITIDPEDTIPLGLSETKTFLWDLQFENLDGDVQTLLYGKFTIMQDITKASGVSLPANRGPLATVSTDYTPESSDRVILVSSVTNPVTITVPAGQAIGKTFEIKDRYGTCVTNPIIVVPTAPDTIDYQSSFTFTTNFQAITIVYDGLNWSVI